MGLPVLVQLLPQLVRLYILVMVPLVPVQLQLLLAPLYIRVAVLLVPVQRPRQLVLQNIPVQLFQVQQ